MVHARLVFLALIASLCEVSHGACTRRGRAGGAVSRVVPRVSAPPCLATSPGPGRRYERTLEEIISKLINAFIYTTIRNSNGGGGTGSGIGGGAGSEGSGLGGSGSGGIGNSVLDVGLQLAGQELVNLDVLPRTTGGSSGSSASSGGSDNSLVSLDAALAGQDIVNLDVLSRTTGGSDSSGGDASNGRRSSDLLALLQNILDCEVEYGNTDLLKLVLLGKE